MLPFFGFSANIAIIESQSNHPMQTMDANWETVVSNMGHTATILPQTSLDNLSSFNGYDILIISSGLIDLPMNRRETAKAFFMSGRSMYLQSEYQLTHPGNMMFAEIITENGNTFTWEGESSGSITPMEIVCGLGNGLNQITYLSYFWYGTYGTGDNSVIPFLKSNDKAYGFNYNPNDDNLGRVITTTDQDWVRILNSEPLMQNIIHELTQPNNISTTFPTVDIELIDEPLCVNGIYTFNSNVANPNNDMEYQWQVNGQSVPNSNTANYSSTDLTEGDVIECVIILDANCEMYSHISNPVLIAPIFPISEATFSISSTQAFSCEGEEVIFNSEIQSEGIYSVISYQWQVNNNDIIGANADSFSTTSLNNSDLVICNVQYTDACSSLNLLSSNEVTVSVILAATPTLEVLATNLTACSGEELVFSLSGNDWGAQPSFQWQVNGTNVGNNENTLSINSLTDGQQVTCILTASGNCLSSDQVTATPLTVNISNSLVPTLSINISNSVVCPDEIVTFTAGGENWGNSPFFSWTINGLSTGDNNPVFTSNNLTNNDEVSCTIFMNEPCLSIDQLNAVAEMVTVQDAVTPIISILTNTEASCKGSEITFTANIQNGGTNPNYEWMVDNSIIGNNTATFQTSTLTDGQIVSCQLTSDVECTTENTAISNLISVDISDITLVVNQQNDDYCGMGNGKIQVGANFAFGQVEYLWSNGETTTTIKELLAGTYSVTATDALGCSSSLSVNIEETNGLEIERLDLQESTCGEKNGAAFVTMTDGSRTYFFTWTNENGNVLGMESNLSNLSPGKYLLEITDETDCYIVEEVIIGGTSMVLLEMEEIQYVNWGDSVKLEPYITGTGTGNLTYEWSPAEGLNCDDCPSPTFSAELEVTYTLTVTSETGCSAMKSVLVYVKKEHEVFIPNVFSPNADGNNDCFTAFAGDKVRSINSMTVADRWGNILFQKQDFEANNELAGWDGTSRGKQLNVGVYIYKMEVEFIDGHVRSFSGDVTLVR
jgi:gliding motility-associated-like protein